MKPAFLTTFSVTVSLFPLFLFCAVAEDSSSDAPVAPGSVLRITEEEDQILKVRTRIRHTTILVLPKGENILDFVVGDSDYWHLTGSANVAYLKPLEQNLETNVTLVCSSGRIYVFLVSEEEPPHLVVRIERPTPKNAAPRVQKPPFVARSMIEGYQRAAQQASEAAKIANQEAQAQITTARQEAQNSIDTFRSTYPHKLRWPYRLERTAFQPPFSVEAMWADNRFTYLKSIAEEAPALYELQDGKPSLVAYDLEDNGLFIVRRHVGEGWLQIGDKKARWRVIPEQ